VYISILRIKSREVIYEYFIFDVAEDELIVSTKEGSDGMFVEFDTLDDLVATHIDVIEDIAVHNCVDAVLLARSNTTDRTASLVNKLCFAGLYILENRIRIYIPSAYSAVIRTTDQSVALNV
jgi:hypothetical protein